MAPRWFVATPERSILKIAPRVLTARYIPKFWGAVKVNVGHPVLPTLEFKLECEVIIVHPKAKHVVRSIISLENTLFFRCVRSEVIVQSFVTDASSRVGGTSERQ